MRFNRNSYIILPEEKKTCIGGDLKELCLYAERYRTKKEHF